MTMPVCVNPAIELSAGSVSGRARPKSSSLTPFGVRKTFDGLRSRWTMPRVCSADSAARMPRPIGTESETLIADADPTRIEQALANLLDNALLHGEGTVTVTLVQGARLGIASVGSDGILSYTPNANANGTDAVSYTVSVNGGAASAPAVANGFRKFALEIAKERERRFRTPLLAHEQHRDHGRQQSNRQSGLNSFRVRYTF